MKIFLAGCQTRLDIVAEVMEVDPDAAIPCRDNVREPITGSARVRGGIPNTVNQNIFDTDKDLQGYKPYILESFYYADEYTEKMIPHFGDFLLDSGAFTFMENSKVRLDWDGYLEKYADFINRNDVKKFFELDIDSIVGYEQVLKYREKLENLTGKKCIPVWHSNRGKDEFLKMCDDYDYVSLGGIVGKEWQADKYIPWFIKEAHKRKTKIHGLGYTKLSKLEQMHFDSVDSTAWTTGNRFGHIFEFKDGKILKHNAPQGHRIGDARKAAIINFREWRKYSKWAETNL